MELPRSRQDDQLRGFTTPPAREGRLLFQQERLDRDTTPSGALVERGDLFNWEAPMTAELLDRRARDAQLTHQVLDKEHSEGIGHEARSVDS